jgi:hypothetical protein
MVDFAAPPTDVSTDIAPTASPEPGAPDLATPAADVTVGLREMAQPDSTPDTGDDMFAAEPGTNAATIQTMGAELMQDYSALMNSVSGGPQTQARVTSITGQVSNLVSQGQSLNEAVQSLSATDLMILSGSVEREFKNLAEQSKEPGEDLLKLREAIGIAAEIKITEVATEAQALSANIDRGIEQFDRQMQSVGETVASLQENLPDGEVLTEMLSGLSNDNLDAVYLQIDELASANPDNEGLQRLAGQVETFAFHGVIEREQRVADPGPAATEESLSSSPQPESAPERQASPSQADLQRLGQINGLINEGLGSGQNLAEAIRILPADDLRYFSNYVNERLADPTFQVTEKVRELKNALDVATAGTVIGAGANAQLIRELETEGTRVYAAMNSGFVGGPEVTDKVNQLTEAIGTQVTAGADLTQVVAALPQQDLMLLSGALQREFSNPNIDPTEEKQQLLAAVQQASVSIFARLARESTDIAGP